MYCRLFIVMGVFWIMEGITFLIEDPDKTENANIFIWIVDIWNLSQGAIVFALFVMKRRVLNLIKKRWRSRTPKKYQKKKSHGISLLNFSLLFTDVKHSAVNRVLRSRVETV